MGVWIDTDMGVDDLFAVLLVAQQMEIDGMSLVFGNAPMGDVRANAVGARDRFGWTFPITAGASLSLLGNVETAQHVLGETGMPGRGAGFERSAADFTVALPALADWLRGQSAGKVLALGPLTNLATLVLADPDLIAHVDEIIWMGGGITRGNHTASAEFNAFADPEALAVLLARGVPITMVDLDACRKVEIVEADVAAVPDPFLRDLAGGYLDIALSRGRSAMALYDPVAAAVLVRPDLFTFAEAEVSVELSGTLTRGRTVVDMRNQTRANVQIVQDMDISAVKALCLGALG